ncbi:unnamed protein product, partial [marine sediment metagenome]
IYGPTSPMDFGYGHNENIFLGECSGSDSAPCGRPCPWAYDYVEGGKGGYQDWDCFDRVCLDGVNVDMVIQAVNRLEVRKRSKEVIDWVPRRG